MKVKNIKCLNCETVITVDYDNDETYAECGCENGTSLSNTFRMSQPGSLVQAIDKSLVEAQAQQDYDFCKKGEWWNLGSSDKKLYTEWSGRLEEGGFVGGLSVNFITIKPMTQNECRTYLKTNVVMHLGENARILRVDRGIK